MIKRYGRAIFDDDTKGVGQFENGGYVLFTDHESAIAAKDAEIAVLKSNLEEAVAHAERGWNRADYAQKSCQFIAEKVRGRCADIVDNAHWGWDGDCGVAAAIRTADLSDITKP